MTWWHNPAFILIILCFIKINASCVNENLAINGECSTSTIYPCERLFDVNPLGHVIGEVGDWVQYDFGQAVSISVVRIIHYRVRQVEFMFSDNATQQFDSQTDQDALWIIFTFPRITTSSIRITLTNLNSETATTWELKNIEFFDTYIANLAIGAECLFHDLRQCPSMVDQDLNRGRFVRSEDDSDMNSVIITLQGGPYAICHMRILGKFSHELSQLIISMGQQSFEYVIPPSYGAIIWYDIPVNSIITESIELVFQWTPLSGDVIYEIEFYSDDILPIEESTQLSISTDINSEPLPSATPPPSSPIPTTTESVQATPDSGKSKETQTDNTVLIGVVGGSVFGIAIIIGATICITVYLRRRPKANPAESTQNDKPSPAANTEDDKSIYDEISEATQDIKDGYCVAQPDQTPTNVDINRHSLNQSAQGEGSGHEKNTYLTLVDADNPESPYLKPMASQKRQYMTLADTKRQDEDYLAPTEMKGATDSN